MARLLLLRHGQSTWNAEDRWQGWADPPLSPLGESQARAAAAGLAGLELDGVVSSDLERARRTAEVIATVLGLGEVEEDSRLRERDVGDWSGLTGAEIDRRWPGAVKAWRGGRLDQPPGGESDGAMAARVLDALTGLVARRHTALLVVTHGGVIRLVERRLGVEPHPTLHLRGRWVQGDGASLSPGPAVALPDPDPVPPNPGGARAEGTAAQ